MAQIPSELPADHPDFDVSDPASLAALHRAEARHFWHRARRRLVRAELERHGVRAPASVLDLGCGSGDVAAYLAEHGLRVTGVDGHASLLECARRRAPSVRFWLHDLRRGTEALPPGEFDAVLLLDVLEHLDHPERALEDALRRVRPGGLLAGTVPALAWLWSPVDERAGHRRRYEEPELRALLAAVPGLTAVEVKPFFRALVPLLGVQRRVLGRLFSARGSALSELNLAVPPAPLNFGLGALLAVERWLEPALPARLPGASLWFAARRG